MNVFVIAKKQADDLQTAVFFAGESGNEEAVAAFTTHQAAREYVNSADWSSTDTVAELTPIDFLQWLATVHRSGTRYLTVNPVRNVQEGGVSQPVLVIEDQLTELASMLIEKLHTPAPPPPMEIQQIDIYHCERCGRVVRQPSGQLTPVCCDQDMAKPAVDTVATPRQGDVACSAPVGQ